MPQGVEYTVHLFARARDLAGSARLAIDLPEGATTLDLRRQILARVPSLAGLLERSALAVNGEFAADSLVLPPRAEIALLPPVSGG